MFHGGATLLKKELHIISDIIFDERDFIETSREIHPYVTAIHLRVKAWSAHKLFQLIERLRDAGVPTNKVFVNDRVDVAIAAKAGGVQLSYRSLPVQKVAEAFPGIRIGKSVHTLEEAKSAEEDGADYIMFGNVFETDSKPGKPGQGIERLQAMVEAVDIPVIGIGGITTENIEQVLPYTHGVAVLSAMWQAADRPGIVKQFHELLSE